MCDLASYLNSNGLFMRRATADKPRGLVWGLTAHLEDCDFADDIALLSHSQTDIQDKNN